MYVCTKIACRLSHFRGRSVVGVVVVVVVHPIALLVCTTCKSYTSNPPNKNNQQPMSTSHSSSASDIQPSPNKNGGRLNVSSSYHHQQIPDNQLPPVGHSLQNLTEFIHNQNVELSNLVSTTTTHPESSDNNNSNNNNNKHD